METLYARAPEKLITSRNMAETIDQRLKQCEIAVESFLAMELRPNQENPDFYLTYAATMKLLVDNITANSLVIREMQDEIDLHWQRQIARVCRVEQELYACQTDWPVEEPEYNYPLSEEA